MKQSTMLQRCTGGAACTNHMDLGFNVAPLPTAVNERRAPSRQVARTTQKQGAVSPPAHCLFGLESSEVEEQELGRAIAADTGEGQLVFAADGRTIAFLQACSIHIQFAAHQLNPGMASRLQRMVERLAAAQQRGVDAGVLIN